MLRLNYSVAVLMADVVSGGSSSDLSLRAGLIDVLNEFSKEDPVAEHATISLRMYPDREVEILKETLWRLLDKKRSLTAALVDFDRKYFPSSFPRSETPEEAAERIVANFMQGLNGELGG